MTNEVTNEIVTTAAAIPKRYQWKGNAKQRTAIDYWINPTSETFGNAYQSFLKAGFTNTYSKNVIHLAPKWLSEYIDRIELTDDHIKQGIQGIAINAPDSRSPDDTRLKAYETLARIKGIIDNKQSTNVTLVQPILSGRSVHTEYQHQPNESSNSNNNNNEDKLDTENSNEIDSTNSPTSYIEGEVVD